MNIMIITVCVEFMTVVMTSSCKKNPCVNVSVLFVESEFCSVKHIFFIFIIFACDMHIIAEYRRYIISEITDV